MQGHLVQRCHQINLVLTEDHFSWMKHSYIVDDGAPAVRSRLAEIGPGKRKSKPTERRLACQTSQLEQRGRKLHSRLLRKSSAVDELLYSVKNVEVVREQMLQIDRVFKMLVEVHREYNSLLPLEMQE